MRFDIERIRREGNERVNGKQKEKKNTSDGIDIDFIMNTSLSQLTYMNRNKYE